MVILPFEEEFYRSEGNEVVYVGHPLADELESLPEQQQLDNDLRKKFSIADDTHIIGLFPGSRDQEIRELLPIFRATVDKMKLEPNQYRLLISCCRQEFEEEIRSNFRSCELPIEIVDGDAYPIMAACHLALVASGTATLELAYFKKPMVVFYKIGRASHMLYRILCTSPFVCLVNILAKEEVVPEEVTWRDNSDRMSQKARALLEDTKERQVCLEKLETLKDAVFCPGGSMRAAETLSKFLERL